MRRAVKRYTVLLECLIALGILPGCVWSVLTAGVLLSRLFYARVARVRVHALLAAFIVNTPHA